MPVPTATEAQTWANADGSSYTLDQATDALATEKANQAAVCTVPDDADDWPADLAEALLRRAHRNLTTAKAPLGIDGSDDAKEIRRLEAPHRRLVVG